MDLESVLKGAVKAAKDLPKKQEAAYDDAGSTDNRDAGELKGATPNNQIVSTNSNDVTPPTGAFAARPNNFDNGGKVKKTGIALVHKGEEVIPVKHDVSLYRAMHHLNKGGLHRALKVPEGQPIPKDKLEAAKNSDNTHVAHMAHFADTMSHFKH